MMTVSKRIYGRQNEEKSDNHSFMDFNTGFPEDDGMYNRLHAVCTVSLLLGVASLSIILTLSPTLNEYIFLVEYTKTHFQQWFFIWYSLILLLSPIW